jgi:pyruvoyl-dependent arginine decarboxylase
LVPVSSIIPSNAKKIEPIQLAPGKITFCVMAKDIGKKEATAGIGWGIIEGKGKKYGIVAEHTGTNVEEVLVKELKKMASNREMELISYETKIESIEVDDGYGCALAALVYCE